MTENTLSEYLKKKEAEDVLWSVFASFGYCETQTPMLADGGSALRSSLSDSIIKSCKCDALPARFCASGSVFDECGDKICESAQYAIELIGANTAAAYAEPIAASAEALFALGIDDFKIKIGSNTFKDLSEIYNLLVLYGFEKFPEIDMGMIGDDRYTDMFFEIYIGDTPVCRGGIRCENGVKSAGAVFDTGRLLTYYRGNEEAVSGTLIFPEENAEGIAYDIAYNLRVNGCLVEGYVGEGGYKDAEEYAKSSNAGCMIRAFADGRLLIKDFKRNEITETTINEFIDYYDGCDDDCGHHHDDCDCHHHGDDCGCHH